MRIALIPLTLLAALSFIGARAEDALICDFEKADSFKPTAPTAKAESVPGHTGNAVQFSFPEKCSGLFFNGPNQNRGNAAWDQAEGFSFWVKGDGSDHLGGIQLIWNEDYAVRYTYAFPIDSKEWKKVTVAWRDLICVLPGEKCIPLDPKNGNAPSKLGPIMFGKWFFWKDYAAHSYAIDDFKLEAKVEIDTKDYKPEGAPLARVLEKLKKGELITIVTIGDSLTDFAHWANKDTNWPLRLADKLKAEFKSEVKIVNPAIGGTLLKHGMVIIPRWAKPVPEPDLITICYGFNDDDSGMTAPMFLEAQKDAIDRVRRVTKGKSDVLIITTNPAVPKWDKLAGLAESCRAAAKEKNAGIADTYVAFHEAGKENKEHLYCNDTVHMGKDGHELIAETVFKAIKNAGK